MEKITKSNFKFYNKLVNSKNRSYRLKLYFFIFTTINKLTLFLFVTYTS